MNDEICETKPFTYLLESKSFICEFLSHCIVGLGSPSAVQSNIIGYPSNASVGFWGNTSNFGVTEIIIFYYIKTNIFIFFTKSFSKQLIMPSNKQVMFITTHYKDKHK